MEKSEIPYLFDVPRIYDPRGNLSFIQNGDSILPFKIERAYWIYDVPAGESRGAHAHKKMRSVLFALGGSFEVCLFDGEKEWNFILNKPFQGLYIPPGYWRVLRDFSSGSVCLSLTSTPYTEEDYIRDFDDFMAWIKK